MSEADAAEQRQADSPAGDGFPEEDVAPEELDPDLDVADPFAVGEDREPLEPGSGDGSSDQDDDPGH